MLVAKMETLDYGKVYVSLDEVSVVIEGELMSAEPGQIVSIAIEDREPEWLENLQSPEDEDEEQVGPRFIQPRQHHLIWKNNQWVDQRCGCAYHPDDDNGTHGGGPHGHPCKAHEAS